MTVALLLVLLVFQQPPSLSPPFSEHFLLDQFQHGEKFPGEPQVVRDCSLLEEPTELVLEELLNVALLGIENRNLLLS